MARGARNAGGPSEGSTSKAQGRNATSTHANAARASTASHTRRGDRRGNQSPGASPSPSPSPSPARIGKNSRQFDKDSNKPPPSHHDRFSFSQNSTSMLEEAPAPAPATATAKLKPTRSTSYTNPLPLLAEEAKPKSEQAPLTEANLRSLLQSLDSSVGPGSRTGSRSGRRVPVTAAPPQTVTTGANNPSSMRKSKSPKKHDKDKEKKRSRPDPDTHPLNLPPDQLRQLTAQMARQEAEASRASMSMDRDTPETNNGFQIANGTSPPATPSRDAPGAFPEPASDESTNGTNGSIAHDERSPTPPPHRVPPAPKIDPEACKAAGNKFFKAKDYERAILEYTKGAIFPPPKQTFDH